MNNPEEFNNTNPETAVNDGYVADTDVEVLRPENDNNVISEEVTTPNINPVDMLGSMLDTSGMQLLTLEVIQDKNNIQFVRKVINGVAESSYGLHVAKLAGIPQSVIRSASIFQKQHFASYSTFSDSEQFDLFTDTSKLDNSEINSIVDKIMDFDVSSSTPIDALLLVSKLQSEISNLNKEK